jgi:hypothetical protein
MSGMPTLPLATGTGLVVTPHPLTLQGQRLYHAEAVLMLPGDYLGDVLARHEVVAGQQWVVSLGGVEVAECQWHRIKPKHGYLIEARRVPEKQVLQIVALVVLVYFTGGLAAAGIAGFAAGGSLGAYLVAGAVYMAGSIVINKLLGPKPATPAAAVNKSAAAIANNTNSPSYSLQAGKNRARQFETMGLVLGQPYCVPDLAGQPYTFFANGEQYLWQLFHFGINCASVDTLRVGQTPVENYQGVQVLRDGFDSGNTGLPALTTNVDSVAGGLLEAPAGYGPYVARTSSTNTIMLSVDLEASLYGVDGQTGAYINNTLDLSLEYRPAGAGGWLAFPLNGDLNVRLANASSKPLRVTYQLTVVAGQYDVRLRKLTADVSSGSAINTVSWQLLKSYQVDDGNYKGQSRVAVQAQATGQLNGTLDELNGQCTAKPMPYWNGSAWVTATSRANGLSNPGALILLLARGIRDVDGKLIAGLGLPDAEIDIEGLKLFMVFCAAKGFTFDLFLQENTSIGDLIESIAAAGLGSRSEHTGKLGVIWFSDDQPVEGVLNMTTMKAKSFSVEYNTQETADEIEYQYFDRARNNTWKSVRVLAPGVTVPQRTARQPLQGVIFEAHAAILARFSMAQNVYHRKTVSCDVDLEHMTFRRGTVMAISHDLTQWGYGGRVQAAVNNAGLLTFTLDDVVPATSPTGAVSRYLGLRIAGEAQYRIFPVAAFTGTTRSLTLATAWPGGVAVPGDSSSNPAHDTIWIYDFKATPGQKLRVSDVSPQGNLDGAKVQLVPETTEFWNYVWNGAYTPPPNNSLLNRGAPVVTRAVVTEQLARQGNTYYVELTLTFDVTGSFENAELWGAPGGGVLQRLGDTHSQQLSWRGGLQETWTLELRPYSATRVGATYRLNYTVLGLAVPPPNVVNFTIDGPRLSWGAVVAVDLAGYEIRFNYGVNTWWDAAARLQQGLITDSPYILSQKLQGVVTLLIKAKDTTGNYSVTGASIVVNLGIPLVSNLFVSWPEAPLFSSGVLTGGSVVGGTLQANALDLFFATAGEPMFSPDTDVFYPVGSYDTMVYSWSVTPTVLGTLLLDFTIAASNYQIEYQRGDQGSFFGPTLDYMFSPGADPMFGTPLPWTVWPGSLNILTAEQISFRITTIGGATQGVVSVATPKLDVPDILESFNDLVISAGGTRLPITKSYRVIENIQITVQADGNGGVTARIEDKNATLGPLIRVFNAIGTAVVGLVDIDIQGY